ncbi:YfbK domain-containing protein [Myxococcus landrumensis]|uniref:von Willebrand factor type A domain-containing protein n=1 Tax=Myxococcus landrumensis TaxID=2813577 RepID=A0ABX7N7J6_9BACT|nr:von Willebrand factor type A domain-containing protein [Myxococcus landrumus]QSQ14443.1 von Willebrand factor type A domain-containing protein [Myxococcus landrumus]
MKSVIPGALCGLLLLFALPVLAQNPATGGLMGSVLDSRSQLPISGVVVTVSSPELKAARKASTDVRGGYRLPALPPGLYTLRFEGDTFLPLVRHQVRVASGKTQRVDVRLLPDDSRGEGVKVAGIPPTLDVGSTTTGVTVDQQFIRRIAVARPRAGARPMRSYESLAEREDGPVSPSIPHVSYGITSSGIVLSAEAHDITRTPSPREPGTPASTLPAATVVAPPSSVPEDPSRLSPPNGARFFDMYFKGHGVNPTVNTEEERYSTFSVDTDSASYTLTRAYLERQALPDEQAVRVEEFVNSFDYGYSADPDALFGIHVDGFPSPVRKGYQVVRIGVKAREVLAAQRAPSHLVFVVDVSGSMEMENRLGLVKRALMMLVEELDERDLVSIVVYGSQAKVVVAPTSATEKARLFAAIDSLSSEGSTNAQAGMELGYRVASRRLLKGGINRVILCSDGVANNGITDADGIWARVKDFAAQGITLSTVGFGMGNYNDVLMERLAQVGEGQYAYVDGLKAAHRIFVENLTGTLQVVAKDVKLQVEFDPKDVSMYRLLGYENRMLRTEQFLDDRVDAGEVGAGHSVTALYEVKPREGATHLGTLRIRYKAPQGGDSKELKASLDVSWLRPSYQEASPATRLAYVASAFAEKLRGSYWTRPLTYAALLSLWEDLRASMTSREDVRELGELIRKASTLDTREDRFESFAPVKSMDFDREPSLPSEAPSPS